MWAKEESVLLYEDRRVVVTIPAGFEYQRTINEGGTVRLHLVALQERVSLDITLTPDPTGEFASPRARKEFLVERFHEYVEASVEQAMEFEEFTVGGSKGTGTYCVLTDARLVRQPVLPPNEYRLVTVGMKVAGGCAAVFTLFSDDTTSKEYTAAMATLREGLQVKTTESK
jgi:hypothetical protein